MKAIKTIIHDGLEYSLNESEKTASIISCASLIIDILIPKSIIYENQEYTVTKINNSSFENNDSIHSIQFPSNSNIQIIEKTAFSDSTIESLSIPSSLIKLEKGWCIGTPKLTKINVDPGNPMYSLYEEKFIIGKSSIESDNFDVLVFCVRDVVSVTIPSFIKRIGPYSFNECHNLKQIEILEDSNLQFIDDYAFCNSSIESIEIPSSVTKIGEGSFSSCYSIKGVKIPINSNINSIATYLFAFSSIETFSIPSNVTRICEHAFTSCKNLHTIEIPNNSNLQVIENCAFYDCCFDSITIPSKLTTLEPEWCYYAYNLNIINVIPNNLNYSSFEDKFILGKSNKEKVNFNVLNFSIRNIVKAVIPSFIEIIQSYSFESCDKLQKIEFLSDSKLQKIEKFSFFKSSIESISIPSYVIDLEKGWCCQTPSLINIKVCSNNSRYSMYNDHLMIGKSNFEKENFDSIVFCSRNCEKAEIPDFIEIIEEFAFEQCFKLKKIEISHNSKLQIIEKEAFSNTSIEMILFPNNLVEIKEKSFVCCDKLKFVDISVDSKLQSIGKYSFNYSSIECFYFPHNLIQIDECAFYFCENLAIVEIDENSKIQQIDESLFYGCDKIKIMIPTKLSKNLNFNK